MLKIENLNAYYGFNHVLKDVSLEVKDGEIVALLGRNGAGKTTLLKSILGLIKSKSGKIWIGDKDVSSLAAHKIIQLGVSYVPQEPVVFPELTVLENLQTRLQGRKVPEENLRFLLDLFPYLKDKLNRYAGTLSGGEQKMLAIARALVVKPKLILMDEPLGGLMPLVCSKLQDFLKLLTSEGTSVLLVEQTVKMALGCANRAYIIDRGVIVHEEDAVELSKDVDTLTKYLGILRVSHI
ncbi:MAG: ABC transporter ATP-binding protein [Candidatus Bathyarchaeia archaeon]